MSKKKEILFEKQNNLQSLLDFFIAHGVSPFNAELLLHINITALGNENTSFINAAENNDWQTIWAVAQLYVDGDLW